MYYGLLVEKQLNDIFCLRKKKCFCQFVCLITFSYLTPFSQQIVCILFDAAQEECLESWVETGHQNVDNTIADLALSMKKRAADREMEQLATEGDSDQNARISFTDSLTDTPFDTALPIPKSAYLLFQVICVKYSELSITKQYITPMIKI